MNLDPQHRAGAKVVYTAFVRDREQRQFTRRVGAMSVVASLAIAALLVRPLPLQYWLALGVFTTPFALALVAVMPYVAAAAKSLEVLAASTVHVCQFNGATAVLTTSTTSDFEIRLGILASWPKGPRAGRYLMHQVVQQEMAKGHKVWGTALPSRADWYVKQGGHVTGRYLIFWRRVEY